LDRTIPTTIVTDSGEMFQPNGEWQPP